MAGTVVGVVTGSNSDLKVMSHAVEVPKESGLAHEARVVSAHRTPDLPYQCAETAAGETGHAPQGARVPRPVQPRYMNGTAQSESRWISAAAPMAAIAASRSVWSGFSVLCSESTSHTASCSRM